MKPTVFNYAEYERLKSELEQVKAERDAMLVDLKKAADDNGRCYGCKHLDEVTDRCSDKEYAAACCLENNKWQWRGLTNT